MMTVRRVPLLLALLLATLAPQAGAQDVRVLASVDASTVGDEEMLRYTLQVQGSSLASVVMPEPPPTEGLVLHQPYPSTQRNISLIHGEMTQSVSYTWTYRPIRTGTAVIRPAEVTVGSETYTTEAIEVEVVPQAQRPQRSGSRARPNPFGAPPPSDTDEEEAPIDERDLFIRVIPSQRTAYQHEQITLTYQLFFREGIQLRQSRLADSWDAEGFWREDLEVDTRPIPRTTIENGLRYNTIILKRVAVFPTRAGELRIDPLRIETEAYVPYGRGRDPFSQFFNRGSRYTPVELSSAPVTIDVQPLPDDPPETFAGAVGSYRLATEVDRREVEVGQSVQVRVRLTGQGNIATMEPPTFEPPGVFEVYDPQVDLSVNRSGRRVSGTKTYTYVLVPRSNGTFELPPITFAYFDPGARQYRTLRSSPRTITVTGTPSAPPAATATSAGLPVDDIAGLMTTPTAWTRTDRTPLHASWWVYVLLLLPLGALAGFFVYHRHTTRLATDTTYARQRMAHPVARKHLKQADALRTAGDARAFYAELERAVLSFIGNRLDIAEQGLTHAQLDDRLRHAGIPDHTRHDLQALLTTCDQVRFAPIAPDRDAMEADQERAATLIAMLDHQFNEATPA